MRHGIPDEIVSENDPQFPSAEFKTFAKNWEFPQSNGQQQAIQTVKNLLKKEHENQSYPYIALLEYRNSPLAGVKPFPCPTANELKTENKTANISTIAQATAT